MSELFNSPRFSSRSPLRYPGGKGPVAKLIVRHIPADVTEMVSPFIGGGSVELLAAARGIQVYASDLFHPLVNFWQQALGNPEGIADLAMDYYPMEKAVFNEMKVNTGSFAGLVDAARYFVLNRSAWSGLTFSGGMGDASKTFTLASIERMRRFTNPNLRVTKASWEEVLPRWPDDTFLYLDPPYPLVSKTRLYGDRSSQYNEDMDHELLASMLKHRPRWILSYNDIPEIRHLYADFPRREVAIRANARTRPNQLKRGRTSKELLVMSPDVYREVNDGRRNI